jgi:hypothetical protein
MELVLTADSTDILRSIHSPTQFQQPTRLAHGLSLPAVEKIAQVPDENAEMI